MPICITQRPHVSDDLLDLIVGEAWLGRHCRVAEQLSAIPYDFEDVGIGKLVHVGSVGMVARLRIEDSRGRPIAFAIGAVAWRAGGAVSFHPFQDVIAAHRNLHFSFR